MFISRADYSFNEMHLSLRGALDKDCSKADVLLHVMLFALITNCLQHILLRESVYNIYCCMTVSRSQQRSLCQQFFGTFRMGEAALIICLF